MDEVKIETRFIKVIISRVIKHFLKKKFGIDSGIQINELNLQYTNDIATGHVSVNFELPKSSLQEILKSIDA